MHVTKVVDLVPEISKHFRLHFYYFSMICYAFLKFAVLKTKAEFMFYNWVLEKNSSGEGTVWLKFGDLLRQRREEKGEGHGGTKGYLFVPSDRVGDGRSRGHGGSRNSGEVELSSGDGMAGR